MPEDNKLNTESRVAPNWESLDLLSARGLWENIKQAVYLQIGLQKEEEIGTEKKIFLKK